MSRLIVNWMLIVGLAAAATHSSAPSADTGQKVEFDGHRMLDELLEFGADIVPLQMQVSRIDQHLDKSGLHLASCIDAILDELRKFQPDMMDDLPLYQAINVILRLHEFAGGCNKASSYALAQAYLLIGGEPKELFETDSKVTHLVLKIALEHKKRCLPEYAKSYALTVPTADKSIVHNLEQLFDREFMAELESSNKIDADFPLSVDLRKLTNDALRMVEKLMHKIKELGGGFKVEDLLKIGKNEDAEFYRRYLISRCRNFNNHLASVFAPARFDSMTFGGQTSDLCGRNRAKFCQHWIIYRICMAYSEANRSGRLMRQMRFLARTIRSTTEQQ